MSDQNKQVTPQLKKTIVRRRSIKLRMAETADALDNLAEDLDNPQDPAAKELADKCFNAATDLWQALADRINKEIGD